MKEKIFKTLEFDKIAILLSNKAISPMGKEKALAILPSYNVNIVKDLQSETTEATSYILRKGSLPLGGIKDIRRVLKRVSVSGSLNIEELMNVSDFVYVCIKVINYSKNEGKDVSSLILDDLFSLIVPLAALEKEINRCIANEKELHDNASEKLRDIRSNINITNNRIKSQLNSIVQSNESKNMLQESVITMRNGRYVVPVKSEHKSSFHGLVHDQSASGATYFIEPAAVVEANNKIAQLVAAEKAEIDRILTKLSSLVAIEREIIGANLEVITKLDFIFAKGELSISQFGIEPIYNTERFINLKKARHPLLNKEKVVPIDIYLGKDFNVLLITGPNTGGKTVSLKTLGLLTLMGQTGLHIPADDKSELAIFQNIFADIGDEQSIEQSLSTFSGHMTNIVSILGQVDENSLVLLDELGSGTDPTEGAALAISIIEFLRNKDARVAVSTHYSELKMYALSTKGAINAACEFNVETLRPTYKLLIGIPGKSNAFAISKRLGLSDNIIENAKSLLSAEVEKFEDIITDLQTNKKLVEIEQNRATEYRREAEKLKKELEQQKEKIHEQKEKIYNKHEVKAKQF